jgi:hypothetical protein
LVSLKFNELPGKINTLRMTAVSLFAVRYDAVPALGPPEEPE